MSGDIPRKDKGFAGLSSLTSDSKHSNDIQSSSQKSFSESYSQSPNSIRSSEGLNESNNEKEVINVSEDQRSIENMVLAYSTIFLSFLIIVGLCFNSKIHAKFAIIDFTDLNLVPSVILLVTLSIIAYNEFKTGAIPDKITLPGILIGLLFTAFFDKGNLINHIIAALGGGLVLFLIAFGYSALTKKEGIGGGIIKLIAMLGAFLGIADVTLIFVLSLMLVIIIAFIHIALSKKGGVFVFEFGLYICFIGTVDVLFPVSSLMWFR